MDVIFENDGRGVKIPPHIFPKERRGGHTHKNKKSNGVLPRQELSLQFVSEQLIFFHKRRDIHMNNSAAMLNQIVPSDYIFRIIIFDAF